MKSESLAVPKAICIGMGLGILVLDVVQMISGTADSNHHWPFFVPAVFGLFVLIIRRIEKGVARLTPEDRDRLVDRATLDSYLHPDHLPDANKRNGIG